MQDGDLLSLISCSWGRRSDRWQVEDAKWHNLYRFTQYLRSMCLEQLRYIGNRTLIFALYSPNSRTQTVCWCPPYISAVKRMSDGGVAQNQQDQRGVDWSGPKFSLLFSGPASQSDSLAKALRDLLAEVYEFDVENDSTSQDVASEEVGQPIERNILVDVYDGGVLIPPCLTFSGAWYN